MAKFTIITTCKARLSHLKQTLPRFAKQRNAEVIVVDYSCPENTAAWVRENYPQVGVVEVPDQPYFRAAHARNAGAVRASSPYLVFLDADTLIADDFMDRVEYAMKPGISLRLRYPKGNDLNGGCIVAAEAFQAIGGYDDVIEGYGGGEQELYWRLRRFGLKAEFLSTENLCEPILHDNTSRMAYQAQQDLRRSFLQVRAYRLCKEALLGVVFVPDLPRSHREHLWQRVKEALASDKDHIKIALLHPPIKSGFLSDWEFKRVVNVHLQRKTRPQG